ncbi:MAG: prepilin-type cleavage/methylation domain-containing protein [Gammaproteobacteria bacterium]|nr:prepilin-type cleavage/methylation domain-containing protein [Gammaproteobacteria bacterium]
MRPIGRVAKWQEGFALSRVVMVVAVLCLLAIGAVLVQSLIEGSRIRQAIDDLNGTTAAVFAYQDRYGRTPGDDGPAATLAARGAGWSGVIAGDVDGSLGVGPNQIFSGDGESGPFWQQLKAAGFISGDPAIAGQAALPDNPWGGLISVLGSKMGGGLDGNKVCLSQVPGSAALEIDSELDDGAGASGGLRATLGSEGANTNPSNAILASPYSQESIYTICYRM